MGYTSFRKENEGVLGGTPKQSGAGGVMGASADYFSPASLQFCHMAKLPKKHFGILKGGSP